MSCTFNIFQMVKKSPTECWIVAGQWIYHHPSKILLSAVYKIPRRRLQHVLPWWNLRKWWVVVFLLSSLIQSFIIPITFNFSSLCSWTFASWYDRQEFCWSKHLLSQLCSSSSVLPTLTQCGISRILLPFRFYVKSILTIWTGLNFLFL